MVEEGDALTGPSSNICKRGNLHSAVCMGSGHFLCQEVWLALACSNSVS